MSTKKNVLSTTLLAGLMSMALFSPAQAAGTLNGEIGVKLTIGAGCTVSNGGVANGVNNWGTIDFGTHSNLTNAIDGTLIGTNGTSTISINCTDGLTANLALDGGLYGSGGLRSMSAGGPDRVAYRLYSDSGRSDEITVNASIPVVADGSAQSIPIFGRVVPADQGSTSPAAGTYSDTILATLTW